MSQVLDFGLGLLIIALAAFFAWNLVNFLVRWIGPYPLLALPVALILLIVSGKAGHDYGLPNLFRPAVLKTVSSFGEILEAPESRLQFDSGLSVMWLFALIAFAVHLLDRMRYRETRSLERKLEKLDRYLRPIAPWRWFRSRRRRQPQAPSPAGGAPGAGHELARHARQGMAYEAVLVPCEALAALSSLPAFLDLATDSRATFFASLLSPSGISWGWLAGIHLGLLSVACVAWTLRRLVSPAFFRALFDFKYLREDPKFKWGNCGRMLLLMGPFLVAYAGVVLASRRDRPFTLPVSSLLCVLFGLWVVVLSLSKVLNRTLRVLAFGLLLLVAFLCNGTDLANSPDEFKLRLPWMSASRTTSLDEARPPYYDYYERPEGLDSRSYLDRCYLDPVPVADVTHDGPRSRITITSARAHGLRDGDHVRIGGVWGCTNANGLFAIETIEGSKNRFRLLNAAANGDYRHGGEWFVDLGHGHIARITREADGTVVVTSPGHLLQDGDRVAMIDGRGSLGFHGEFEVAIRHDDARSSDQFTLVGRVEAPARPYTWGGRWRRTRAVVHRGRTGPTQGGISWVSIPQPSLFGPAQAIVVESRGHGILDGDRVLIEDVVANPAANGLWTATVDQGDGDFFTLGHAIGEAREVAPRKSREALKHGREAAGRWRVLANRGRVVDATNAEGEDIRITSPRHGLKPGQHVEIAGVRGNTRANGVFTVGPADLDRFALIRMGPTSYDPSFNYISGGEWRLAPEKGRIVRVEVTEAGKVRVLSHAHHLKPGTRVRVGGLEDAHLRKVNGVFAIEGVDGDRFELVGASAAAPSPGHYDYGRLGELANGQPTWQVSLDSGGIAEVTKQPGHPIVVHSPRHGLTPGDHVQIKGRRWASGIATYPVDLPPEGQADAFWLAGTEEVPLEDDREGTPSGPDEGPGGEWRIVEGQGGIAAFSIAGGQVQVVSPRHHLRGGERVQISGLPWDRERGSEVGLFTVAPGPGRDWFHLRGTSRHYVMSDLRSMRRISRDAFFDEPKEDAVSPGGVLVGRWRYGFRPRDRDPVRFTEASAIPGGLRVESIHHGMKPGDCVQIAHVYSAPRGGRPARPEPKLSTRANGLFRIESVPDPDHFEVKFSPGAGPVVDDLEYFRGDWLHQLDQGFVEESEAQGDRTRVRSAGHGLSAGSRVLVEGTDRASIVTASGIDPDHFTLDQAGVIKEGARWCLASLLDDAALLANWEARRARDERLGKDPKAPPPAKPKLALVAVSGGGVRSAIWTAKVLEQLESAIPELPYHVRLVTGASGGMLGAGAYVASLLPPDAGGRPRHEPGLREMAGHLGGDFLRPVANQLVFSDLPMMFYPATQRNDRGRMLEAAWTRPGLGSHPGAALDRKFRDLAVGEWEGWRPSLAFTPMLVEDGRRVLISNLDLDYAQSNVGHVLLPADTRKLSTNSRLASDNLKEGFDIFSLSAVEFFRLFPEAWDFRVSTAIRMSAAFPMITPAVSLPTIPPRRVVDAGYYDNYGVNLASLWLLQNHEWLMEHTSGVVLIQVRDFQAERARRELGAEPDHPAASGIARRLFRSSHLTSWLLDWFEKGDRNAGRGSQWLTSPIEGASVARYSINSFRNDEQIEALSQLIHFLKPGKPVRPGFYTTVVFECPKEASLSWAVTAQEALDIRDGFRPDRIEPGFAEGARKNADRLNQLENWWKN